jgi:fatty-acyl-CoA synthase
MIDPAADLSHWLDRWADVQPGKCAIRFAGADISYDALARRVRRAATLLARAGVTRGDRVAFLGLNHPDLIVLLFAAARRGAMLCPLNWRLAPAEHAAILEHAEPKAIFVEPEFVAATEGIANALGIAHRFVVGPAEHAWPDLDRALAAASAEVPDRPGRLDDAVLLVYTSGTTGRPKGAVLTQGALFWNAVNSTHAHDLVSSDRVLTFLPMFHVGGLNIQTVPALHAGATVVLQRRFEPAAAFDAIEAERPTLTLMVPAVMQALIGHPRFAGADFSSLRMINAGSSTIPAALIHAFHIRGVPVGQVYGSTETGPIAAYLRREDAMAHVGSTGKAAVHCRLRIVDDAGRDVPAGTSGELWIAGPNVMTGYWRDPAASAQALADGWFRTGDIGYADGGGFIWINDRKGDLIISGGENIYPAELENVLADCPDIAEAAVVARPDRRWGEVAVAIVVPRGPDLSRERVIGLFDGRLARFKHPRDVVFVDKLPRNVMGKVLKHELRAQLDR